MYILMGPSLPLPSWRRRRLSLWICRHGCMMRDARGIHVVSRWRGRGAFVMRQTCGNNQHGVIAAMAEGSVECGEALYLCVCLSVGR